MFLKAWCSLRHTEHLKLRRHQKKGQTQYTFSAEFKMAMSILKMSWWLEEWSPNIIYRGSRRQSFLTSWFILVLAVTVILINQVVWVLLCKANEISLSLRLKCSNWDWGIAFQILSKKYAPLTCLYKL